MAKTQKCLMFFRENFWSFANYLWKCEKIRGPGESFKRSRFADFLMCSRPHLSKLRWKFCTFEWKCTKSWNFLENWLFLVLNIFLQFSEYILRGVTEFAYNTFWRRSFRWNEEKFSPSKVKTNISLNTK